PSMGLAAGSIALGALLYLPVALLQLPSRMPAVRVDAAMVLLGAVCTAAAFVCFFELIREIGPSRSTVITYVNPAVAVALGVAFGGDAFGLTTALGFVLILGGSILATRTRRRSRLPVAPTPS
ncbi:MAG: EamA family transporter, partial [Acidimicrobiales bacterium]